ncbi:hypothetical protein [Pseudonocardia parietis]|uniref:FXSXX-COOH protein n=1 Tax=Pseudonocardia parietis TaxID=570936 RepID=A0ABS4W6T8_9PSEU|nr:hypothetical protein [Pseudonocardia parietis]MBP2371901.1 hypothetical protein [Pseudonocardia parietis]
MDHPPSTAPEAGTSLDPGEILAIAEQSDAPHEVLAAIDRLDRSERFYFLVDLWSAH